MRPRVINIAVEITSVHKKIWKLKINERKIAIPPKSAAGALKQVPNYAAKSIEIRGDYKQ